MEQEKFYAVKKGHIPGIYKTWSECQKQTNGFSGAVFKKFNNLEDATLYLENNSIENNKSFTTNETYKKDVLYAYIDGSYNQAINSVGYGLILVLNDEIILEKKEGFIGEKFNKYRNVYGELKGTVEAVKIALELKQKSISIVYDYTGIENWATGNWKTNNSLTAKYADKMKELSKLIDISFIKVKAHAKESDGGDKYNDIADKLAKEAVGVL